MKKSLLFVLLCTLLAGVSQAKDIYRQEIYKMDTSAQEKSIHEKVALSAISIGDNVLVLDNVETIPTADGKAKKIYTYYPQNGKKVAFRETVSVDIHTGKPTIIKESSVTNRIIGPLKWYFVDYEISSVEITIYPKDVLRSLRNEWARQVGHECIINYSKFPNILDFDYLDMLHTPAMAFRTQDNRTVEVVAYAASKEFGPYRRTCSLKAPGVLYNKVANMVDNLKHNLDK